MVGYVGYAYYLGPADAEANASAGTQAKGNIERHELRSPTR
jgi:hypothetical protein